MRIILACFVLALAAPGSASSNWPQWRGPEQPGVSPATDMPSEWSAEVGVVPARHCSRNLVSRFPS